MTDGGGAQAAAAAAAAFQPKRGSVFPAKRKLVKTMILDLIVEKIFDFFEGVQPNRALSGRMKMMKKKKKKIHHHVISLP